MSKISLTTAAAATPIVIADVNAHLKWDDAASNTDVDSAAYLTTLIDRALDIAETETWSKFYTQTWAEYFDGFDDIIRPTLQPIQSIVTPFITYTDTAGATQTLSSTVYELGKEHGRDVIRLKYSQTWPATRDHADVVCVNMIVGYGVAAAIPNALRHAMLMIVAALATHRGDTDFEIPKAARQLLSQYTFHAIR
jgi:uncharacterized phiE125 gp8 family phage protein